MDILKKTNKDILSSELNKLNNELDMLALKKAKILIALRDIESTQHSKGALA